jgi:hypothetical protein
MRHTYQVEVEEGTKEGLSGVAKPRRISGNGEKEVSLRMLRVSTGQRIGP